jgi:hypothetical protein
MTSAMLYCLTHIGRGNAANWQKEAVYQGGFSLPDRLKPYTRCEYSTKGVKIHATGQGTKIFTASMCDAVANTKQLTLL